MVLPLQRGAVGPFFANKLSIHNARGLYGRNLAQLLANRWACHIFVESASEIIKENNDKKLLSKQSEPPNYQK